MADVGGGELEAFRAEVRDWLAANYPPSLNAPMDDETEAPWGGRRFNPTNKDAKLWLDRMAAKGWTAPMWPTEYGGGGLTPRAEQGAGGRTAAASRPARPLMSFGIWMLGPMLLEYGTEEQKQEHLPGIVTGEIRWCQGYSEPGAGSDLAGLQTRAEDKGDHFLVNGQKIWTSYGDQCRLDASAWCAPTPSKKHEGISFVLFDMTTPGRRDAADQADQRLLAVLRDLLHRREGAQGPPGRAAERRLDDRQAPAAVSSARTSPPAASAARRPAHPTWSRRPRPACRRRRRRPHRRRRPAQPDQRAQDGRGGLRPDHPSRRAGGQGQQGPVAPPPRSSNTPPPSSNQERTELTVEALGLQGLGWEGERLLGRRDRRRCARLLRAKANSIEGGTSEINLNVVAKRVLGLLDHQ